MKLNDVVAGLYSGLSNAVGVPSNAQAVRDYLDIRKELPKKDRNGLKTLRNIVLISAAAVALVSCGNACGTGPLPSVNSPPAVTSSYNGITNTLSVKAEDIDGVIAGMYQNGSDVLGDDTNPNADVWEADYVNLPAGSHTFKAVDDSGDDDSITVQIPYENVTATASLDASSVQHNMDAAAEVNASVSVSDGGYNYAKWYVDGVYAGTSNESDGFGVNVDFVGTKAVTGELYNSLDEKLADVSAGSVDGLDTIPDDVYAVAGEGLNKEGEDHYKTQVDAGGTLETYLYFSDPNNDPGAVLFRNGSAGGNFITELPSWLTMEATTTPGKFKLYGTPTEDDIANYDLDFYAKDSTYNEESANNTFVEIGVTQPL